MVILTITKYSQVATVHNQKYYSLGLLMINIVYPKFHLTYCHHCYCHCDYHYDYCYYYGYYYYCYYYEGPFLLLNLRPSLL